MSGITLTVYDDNLIPTWEFNIDSVLNEHYTFSNTSGNSINDAGFTVTDAINLDPMQYVVRFLVCSEDFAKTPLYVGELSAPPINLPARGTSKELAYYNILEWLRGKVVDIVCVKFGFLQSMVMDSHDFPIEQKSGYEVTASFSQKMFAQAETIDATISVKKKASGGKKSTDGDVVYGPEEAPPVEDKKSLYVKIQEAAAAMGELYQDSSKAAAEATKRSTQPSQFKKDKIRKGQRRNPN